MLLERKNALRILFEGYVFFLIVHIFVSYFIGLGLQELFVTAPKITINNLASSAISPILTIIYLMLRINFFPRFYFNEKVLMCLGAGFVLIFFKQFSWKIIAGKDYSLINFLDVPPPYYYLHLFLVIVWGPIIEEILFRGYFLEIALYRWGQPLAIIISSLLFTIPHSLGGYEFNIYLIISLVFFFLWQVIFSLVYLVGGISASILVHVMNNAYSVYLVS
jgi:membrane protease YdiL (CAAX protease family)